MPDEDDKPRRGLRFGRADDRDVLRVKTPPAGVRVALQHDNTPPAAISRTIEVQSWEEPTDVGKPLLNQIADRTKRSSVGVEDLRRAHGNLEQGLRKLEAGHEELAKHVQMTAVATARTDGKVDTLLSLAQAERDERRQRALLEHEANLKKIDRLPTLLGKVPAIIKALGVAVAAVVAAYLKGWL